MIRTAARATQAELVPGFADLDHGDVATVGGKGANLGELAGAGFPVPDGFVVSASGFNLFRSETGLADRLAEIFCGVDGDEPDALESASAAAREAVLQAAIPIPVSDAIASACADYPGAMFAVRSSATAEDTAAASFAGMNETLLNVTAIDVAGAVRRCWASLFAPRSLAYRAKRGFPFAEMDIAVVVQVMIDSRAAGVMFTVDPASGETDRLVIESATGLGESVVSGAVTPERFVVRKRDLELLDHSANAQETVIESRPGGGTVVRPAGADAPAGTIDSAELREIARLGLAIEAHYGVAQDIEWAIDEGGRVWIVQSRPVTTIAGTRGAPAPADARAEVLARGLGASPGIAAGKAFVALTIADATELEAGDVLVAPMTSPDWAPAMRRAAAIVTDSGGMTCHAAIVAREFGVPCVVGTRNATATISPGALITVDGGAGVVHPGDVSPPELETGMGSSRPTGEPAPPTVTKLMLNLSHPSQLERVAALEVDGVGLLRAEMMLGEALEGTHPRLFIEERGPEELTTRIAAALEKFAVAFEPRPVTYRTIDFRSNEFRGLRGGERFEPVEANPMIGYRGALRYEHEPDLLEIELRALASVRAKGHPNLQVMVPFLRTAGELRSFRDSCSRVGLLDDWRFQMWVMAEVPSVLFNLEAYHRLGAYGISIGSNDLTQLVLGADRDSELVAEVFDERDPAVVAFIRQLIGRARRLGLATSICGQAPSVHTEYAEMLVSAGIDSISVNIDAVDRTRQLVADAEARQSVDEQEPD